MKKKLIKIRIMTTISYEGDSFEVDLKTSLLHASFTTTYEEPTDMKITNKYYEGMITLR